MTIETSSDVHDFHEQLKAILPRLRIYALSLTRDRDAADGARRLNSARIRKETAP